MKKIIISILFILITLLGTNLMAQVELMESEAGIKLGVALTTQQGVIQSTTDDIEGYSEGSWKSLTNANPIYTSSSSLNNTSYNLPNTAWTPVGPATTVIKERENSTLELAFDGTVDATVINGFGVRFQLRINNIYPDHFNMGVIKVNSPPVQTSAKSIYTSLAPGTYTARMYAQAPNSGASASNVSLDPGGWGARILIKEY